MALARCLSAHDAGHCCAQHELLRMRLWRSYTASRPWAFAVARGAATYGAAFTVVTSRRRRRTAARTATSRSAAAVTRRRLSPLALRGVAGSARSKVTTIVRGPIAKALAVLRRDWRALTIVAEQSLGLNL